ncbi:hypothetical protein IRY61_02065 [Candidatus Saccharibacteria bacterium]|nr:hypothetical protein [Candidatus Saccharibacteria bacterium]
MGLFTITQADLSRKAYLFPLMDRGYGGWTWREVLHMKKFVLWTMVLGNLVFGGLLVALFVPGLWRLVAPSSFTDMWNDFFIVVPLFVLVVFAAFVGLFCLRNAIRLMVSLLAGRRYD